MGKRSFLQLAMKYDPAKYNINGWFMSTKLDGQRAYWDGGISRGMLAAQVPWANILKNERYVVPPMATGLWSRYGNIIHAPSWWLNQLPPYGLDGELYMGIGQFQPLMSACKCLEPDDRWREIKYMVFDMPSYGIVFQDGLINETNFKKRFEGIVNWIKTLTKSTPIKQFYDFERTYKWLEENLPQTDNLELLRQVQLPFNTQESNQLVQDRLFDITEAGGEGLMLRKHVSVWVPERTHNLLKVKKLCDAEGTVIGYKWGKETDKGSKLLGMMGSAIIKFNGVQFDLSGFTDEERTMTGVGGLETAKAEGCKHPGEVVGEDYWSLYFPRGTRITFKYRELTDGGVPKECRYWRKGG